VRVHDQEKIMPSGVEIKELSVSYNGNRVLKGINLSVKPGKITALIGPSGCGKTTLLRCINRLSEMTRGCKVNGQIQLDNDEIYQLDPIILRRRVGMVFQKPNPFPMSVRENILYGIKAAKKKVNYDEVVESTLIKSGIWEEIKDRLNDHAFGLSVGQQQRVCIARCLAVSPDVILMDEPAASLDPSSAAKVESSILDMKDEYTIIIVTHNMQQARRVSDHTTFMYLGDIIEFGETRQVFNSPNRQETRAYIDGVFG
jgi:phosphate transport system ATP-binding protein